MWKVKFSVLWCNISGKAAGKMWHWSLSRMKRVNWEAVLPLTFKLSRYATLHVCVGSWEISLSLGRVTQWYPTFTQAKPSWANQFTCVDVVASAHLVLVCFVCHSKRVVLCVGRVPFKVLQLNSQFIVGLTCQSVDLVQPEPELAAQVTEALFVVGPVSKEVDGAVESFLEDSPAPSCCGLVAENVKGLLVVWIDFVDPARCVARFVEFCAVLCNWMKKREKNSGWRCKTILPFPF